MYFYVLVCTILPDPVQGCRIPDDGIRVTGMKTDSVNSLPVALAGPGSSCQCGAVEFIEEGHGFRVTSRGESRNGHGHGPSAKWAVHI